MTAIDVSGIVLSSGLSLIVLWAVVRILYKDALIDAQRIQLFKLRDELFDLARSGALEFNSPAHRYLRRAINGFIGEIQSFGLTWVLASRSRTREDLETLGYKDFKNHWNEAIKALDGDAKEAVRDIEHRLNLHMTAFLILRSPIITLLVLVPALLALFAGLVAFTLGAEIKAGISRYFTDLTATAYAVGR